MLASFQCSLFSVVEVLIATNNVAMVYSACVTYSIDNIDGYESILSMLIVSMQSAITALIIA